MPDCTTHLPCRLVTPETPFFTIDVEGDSAKAKRLWDSHHGSRGRWSSAAVSEPPRVSTCEGFCEFIKELFGFLWESRGAHEGKRCAACSVALCRILLMHACDSRHVMLMTGGCRALCCWAPQAHGSSWMLRTTPRPSSCPTSSLTSALMRALTTGFRTPASRSPATSPSTRKPSARLQAGALCMHQY